MTGDSNRSRVRKSEQTAAFRDIFDAVTSAYVEMRSRPVMAASTLNPDPSSDEVNRKWTPSVAHFCIDVERLTEKALVDEPELQAAWFLLAAGDEVNVDPKTAQTVIARCARLYKSRKLHRYFHPSIKRGRGECV
jgi:hypothetical protein